MSFKDKIANMVAAQPKLVTLGIGLAVTFAVGTAIGMLDHGNLALAQSGGKKSS